jgi:hypothetical protein
VETESSETPANLYAVGPLDLRCDEPRGRPFLFQSVALPLVVNSSDIICDELFLVKPDGACELHQITAKVYLARKFVRSILADRLYVAEPNSRAE